MKESTKWIWLDSELYPNFAKNDENAGYCVAEFKNTYHTTRPSTIRISADARYLLFVNNKQIGRGPTSPGSDFLFGKMEKGYYEEYEISDTGCLEVKVLVTSKPTVLTEYTFGSPGLIIELYSQDELLGTSDESWLCRPLAERIDVLHTDYTIEEHPYTNVKAVLPTHTLLKSTLDKLDEKIIRPNQLAKLEVKGGETRSLRFSFDKIYSAYPYILIKASDKCVVTIESSEFGNVGKIIESVITDKDVLHLSQRMRSIGEMTITIENQGMESASIEDAYILFKHYPVYNEGYFNSSDKLLNRLYNTCMHTLKICRQDIHLDSPTHQEHLACTGDYYIQALIEYLNMYDPTLSALDIKRTAEIIRIQKGRLFHTTYSLIYPQWIYDYYLHTADLDLVKETLPSLKLLLKQFEGYIAEDNGLIEYSHDYMFVDWVIASSCEDKFIDGAQLMSHGKMAGYSLHHPPKALGQGVLCMFYYNALNVIAEIFSLCSDNDTAKKCLKKAKDLKECINKHLFDKEKGLYVGGLNTENRVEENDWLPKNTSVVYYLKQTNTLALLYDIVENKNRQKIYDHIFNNLNKYEMQPYFYHFLLSAIYKDGLFEKYGLQLMRRYESILDKCDKGLGEAWENMNCDHTHAWGASVAYHLKKALSGLEILEAGYKKIKLSPNLYGLDFAEFDITTPYGNIEISMKKGERVSIKAPKEIEIISNDKIITY